MAENATPAAESDARNLPPDERLYAALVEALGQDEDDAQAALDAALPALREAWDSGYFTGAMDEREDPGGKAKPPNPYRTSPD